VFVFLSVAFRRSWGGSGTIGPMAPSISDSRRMLDAVGSGSTKQALEALRDKLILELDQSPPRYVAGLSRELLAVLKTLEGLPSDKPGRSIADEIAARRDERLTARGTVPAQRNGGREREQYPRRQGKPKSS
jgi:hypothetical protein